MTSRRDKRNSRIQKRCAVMILALIICAAQAGAAEQKKVLLGISAGWAFGGGYDFQEHSAGVTNDKATPGYHLGVKVQFDLDEALALQFYASIQDIAFGWEARTSPVEPSDWKSDHGSLCMLGLNGVINFKKAKRSQFYLLGGGGAGFGETNRNYGFSNKGTRLMVVLGSGMRFFLNASMRSAFVLGVTFNQLLNYQESHESFGNSSILQLGVGFEFSPRVRKKDQGDRGPLDD